MRRALLGLVAIALCSGCATLPPPAPPAHTPPPAPAAQTPPTTTQPSTGAADDGIPVGTTASGGTIRVHVPPAAPAAIDSTPSREALAVLNSIPEPLGRPSDRPSAAGAVPADRAPMGAPVDTARARPDSTAATPTDSAASVPTDSAGVPVPEPTRPLGDRPGTLSSAALPESLAAPAATPPASATPPPAAQVSPDSCWRLQVAAPPERERADRLADAARSQLAIAMVVEHEGGLYKVRTKECLTAVAADDLKRRAVATGFDGAFRFRRKR
jgi:sporulation related protein